MMGHLPLATGEVSLHLNKSQVKFIKIVMFEKRLLLIS